MYKRQQWKRLHLYIFYVIVRNGGNFMDYELLEKAAMTKYEMSKKDP